MLFDRRGQHLSTTRRSSKHDMFYYFANFLTGHIKAIKHLCHVSHIFILLVIITYYPGYLQCTVCNVLYECNGVLQE